VEIGIKIEQSQIKMTTKVSIEVEQSQNYVTIINIFSISNFKSWCYKAFLGSQNIVQKIIFIYIS
jgi:hypothetical protein